MYKMYLQRFTQDAIVPSPKPTNNILENDYHVHQGTGQTGVRLKSPAAFQLKSLQLMTSLKRVNP